MKPLMKIDTLWPFVLSRPSSWNALVDVVNAEIEGLHDQRERLIDALGEERQERLRLQDENRRLVSMTLEARKRCPRCGTSILEVFVGGRKVKP